MSEGHIPISGKPRCIPARSPLLFFFPILPLHQDTPILRWTLSELIRDRERRQKKLKEEWMQLIICVHFYSNMGYGKKTEILQSPVYCSTLTFQTDRAGLLIYNLRALLCRYRHLKYLDLTDSQFSHLLLCNTVQWFVKLLQLSA